MASSVSVTVPPVKSRLVTFPVVLKPRRDRPGAAPFPVRPPSGGDRARMAWWPARLSEMGSDGAAMYRSVVAVGDEPS